MVLRSLTLVFSLLILSSSPLLAERVSLRGSAAGMRIQNQVAKDHGLAFYRTPAEIEAALAAGDLVPLAGNDDYSVADFVDLPYLHPAALLFVERLSSQYREACGQKLVVTSAVRATTRQPSNAHALSVHPAAMAVDIRVSDRAACREWLEAAILGMERRGLIDGIREYHPPHYHIAVFPDPYQAYALERIARELELAEGVEAAEDPATIAEPMVFVGANALMEPAVQGGSDEPGGLFLLSVLVLGVPASVGYAVRMLRRS